MSHHLIPPINEIHYFWRYILKNEGYGRPSENPTPESWSACTIYPNSNVSSPSVPINEFHYFCQYTLKNDG